MKQILLAAMISGLLAGSAGAQPLTVTGLGAVVERGTYHNYFSCQYPAYAIFANLGADSGTDSRLGQLLVGWDTANIIPTNLPVTRYLIRSVRATVTINDGNQVIYDPTHDAVETYFATNHPAWQADTDPGRPIELFGVGFRNGYGATNFLQCSPVGNGAVEANNVYALSWTTNGLPRDVGNSVGKTNAHLLPFEPWPFAVAQTTATPPGGTLPPGAQLTFDLNLSDPFVVGYVRRALHKGRLDLMVSSLHQVSGQFGTEPFPSFATRFNQALLHPPTTLDLDVTVVRDLDTDSDGLPDDWEQFYFSSLTNTASGDFDSNGASNEAEYLAGTDPTQANSIFHVTYQREAAQSELRWNNLPSRRFEIRFSDNLVSWQTLTNPALYYPTAQQVIWRETHTAPARFYRVQAVAD
jgi:hypothetical protein